MSSIAFNQFLTKACENPETARAFVQAVGDKQGDEAIQAVAVFAQAQGYDVSTDTAASARQSALATLDGDRALGDDELDGINGGLLLEIGALTILGSYGAMAAATAVLVPTAGVLGVVGVLAQNGGDNPVANWFKQW